MLKENNSRSLMIILTLICSFNNILSMSTSSNSSTKPVVVGLTYVGIAGVAGLIYYKIKKNRKERREATGRMWKAIRNNEEMSKLNVILDQGKADVDGREDEGNYNPLGLAVTGGDLPLVKTLLEYNADPLVPIYPNSIYSNSKTLPIHEAVKYSDMPKLLLTKKKDEQINAPDADGRTPLHHAIFDKQNMRYLLENCANPHIKDCSGETALHCAVSHCEPAAVSLLLACGADSSTINNNGCGILDMAYGTENMEIIKMVTQNLKQRTLVVLFQIPKWSDLPPGILPLISSYIY